MRQRLVVLVIATAAAAAMYTAPARAAVNPAPILPSAESLITEGLTVEGPLINNLNLPHLL